MERWSIMTADGLTLLREDIFTEDEAKAYVERNPYTPSGSAQIAAPESVIRMAAAERSRLGKEAERRLQMERVNATKRILHNHNVLNSLHGPCADCPGCTDKRCVCVACKGRCAF